uniref:Putative secreted protein n=1 Tax=Panstrongylus lignarius TaxID=156445 RepID=A0A224XY49_9HEMI
MWLSFIVCHNMVVQTAFSYKTFTTNITNKILFSRVNFHMGFHGMFRTEYLCADTTRKLWFGFFRKMAFAMQIQRAVLFESFSTFCAYKWAFLAMCCHM